MINIEELRADIAAGTPGDWSFKGSVFRAYVVNAMGKTVVGAWPDDARRIARLPQLEREYLAMREALAPFVECCETISEYEDGEEWAKFLLLVKDYRRAKAAFYGETQ